VDLDLAELAEYLLDDPANPGAAAGSSRGLADPGRLTRARGRAAVARGKRFVVAKVGGTDAGRRAALAHTAHDAGDAASYDPGAVRTWSAARRRPGAD